jgi:uncharacterized membrane protein YgcG
VVRAQLPWRSSRIGSILAVALLIVLASTVFTHTSSAQVAPDGEAESTPVTAINTVPHKPLKFKRVYDTPGLLSKEQYDRFHFDIGRMWGDGLPAVIFIRYSNDATQASQDFADKMRDTWDIESAPGADDGLVMLVTLRERFPQTAIMTLSYGANAFPQGQMTVSVLNDIMEREVLPRIRTGLINDGLTYAVRRILYYAEYTAPFPAPLTDTQEIIHTIALPVAGFVTLLLLACIALPEKYLPAPGWRQAGLFTIAGLTVLLAMILAVAGRHTLASGIALLDLALLLLMFAIHSWRNARRFPVRTIRQTRLAVHSPHHPILRRRTHRA